MSTKATLKYERDDSTRKEFHLYNDLYDEDHLYLALEGFHFEAASSMNLSGEWGPRLTLKLPNSWAHKLGMI
jgi:hypothetical protein